MVDAPRGGRVPVSGASHPCATHDSGGMELIRIATAGGLNQRDDHADWCRES